MTVNLDLGKLEVESEHSGLRLSLLSTAVFAPSVEGELDELQQLLICYQLNPESTCRPWVSRDNFFTLVISLRVDNSVVVADQDALIDALSSQLRNAQLWRQLCYSTPSVQTSVEEVNQTYRIEVFLSHADEPPLRAKRKLHKLGVDVPFYDVKPPSETCRANLETVNLDMCLRKKARLKRQRVAVSDNLAVTKSANHQAQSYKTSDPEDDKLQDLRLEASLEGNASERRLDDLEWLSDSDGEDIDHEGSVMLLGVDEHNTLRALERPQETHSSLKRISSATRTESEETDVVVDTIIELIDSALRCAVSDAPTQLAKGITVKRDENSLALSSIAPSLWPPGYLAAVSDRAIFLPTISHALEGICTRHATSDDLKVLGTRLSARARRNLPVRLWQNLERGLYDAKAARRLKPLRTDVGSSSQNLEFGIELLDASQSSVEWDTALDENGNEDFLLDQQVAEEYCQDFDDDLLGYVSEDDDYTDEQNACVYTLDLFSSNTAMVHCLRKGRDGEVHGQQHSSWGQSRMTNAPQTGNGSTELIEEDTMSICDSFDAFSLDEELRVDHDTFIEPGCEHDTQEVLAI